LSEREVKLIGENKITFGGVVQIIRPHVGLQGAAFTVLGAYLSGGLGQVLTWNVLIVAGVVFLSIAFAFVINDVKDMAVDSINKPNHPIPSGKISRSGAETLAIALAVLTVGVASTVGLWSTAIALGLVVLSALYSVYLKNTVLWGNCTVALLNATILPYGALAAGNLSNIVWLASTLAFLYTCAQEILYTVRDKDADAQMHLRTVAVCWGTPKSLLLFQILTFVYIFIAIIPVLLQLARPAYLYAVIACSILPLVANVLLVSQDASDNGIFRACRWNKLIRVLSLVPMILLR